MFSGFKTNSPIEMINSGANISTYFFQFWKSPGPILQKKFIAKTNRVFFSRSYTKIRRLCFHYLRQLCKRAFVISVRHYK